MKGNSGRGRQPDLATSLPCRAFAGCDAKMQSKMTWLPVRAEQKFETLHLLKQKDHINSKVAAMRVTMLVSKGGNS
jgi:hypothetical protein